LIGIKIIPSSQKYRLITFSGWWESLALEAVSQYEKYAVGKRGEAVGDVGRLAGKRLSKDKRDATQKFRAATFNRSDSGPPTIGRHSILSQQPFPIPKRPAF
jgi:hypothetical protein